MSKPERYSIQISIVSIDDDGYVFDDVSVLMLSRATTDPVALEAAARKALKTAEAKFAEFAIFEDTSPRALPEDDERREYPRNESVFLDDRFDEHGRHLSPDGMTVWDSKSGAWVPNF